MEEVLKEICKDYSVEETAIVMAAYELARKVLDGKMRSNNRPFLEHPVGVARIVGCEIALDAESVAAVFLHEASREDPAIIESYTADAKVVALAESLNRISQIKPRDTNLEADRYRKLIASYSTDPRVFIIKLADRLEVMRSLSIFSKSDQARKNAETMLLYIPLAHQAGLYHIKGELEDLWLKYAEPESYRAITNYLKATESDRNSLVESFIRPLEGAITAKGIKYHLKARTKSAYSIWKKMLAQRIPINEVYDVFAIRFIIDVPPEKEIATCWDVFATVTEKYPQDPRRLRQWLERPKPSGYQSLHCTVQVDGRQWVEVQIRSERMDYEAELGGASHWAYKGVKKDAVIGGWLAKVRSMMESPDHSGYEQVDSSMLSQDIFVFTPDGELRQLRAGATVLDFAFDIHSNVGLKCSGGRINGKMASIKDLLKTGDTVEIITSKNQQPNEGWLNFVVTSKARSKIKQKLAQRENALAASGKEILERRLKNWKITLKDEDLSQLIKKYKFRTANEFFSAVGEEKVDLAEIKLFLQPKETVEEKPEAPGAEAPAKPREQAGKGDYLEIGDKTNLNGVDYRMAKCCNPVYGDDVFGFVTISSGIKIHRMSCPNAARLLDSYPHRIQKVRWRKYVDTSAFQVDLKVTTDEESTVNDVISTISGFHALVRKLNVSERNKKGEIEITTTIFVNNNLTLDKILATLKKNKYVRNVSRN